VLVPILEQAVEVEAAKALPLLVSEEKVLEGKGPAKTEEASCLASVPRNSWDLDKNWPVHRPSTHARGMEMPHKG
jgi:hypothetical protein